MSNDIEIRVKAQDDTGHGFESARRGATALTGHLTSATGAAGRLMKSLTVMSVGATAVLGVAGAAAAVVPAMAGAGAALGVFGAVVASTFGDVAEASKTTGDLREKMEKLGEQAKAADAAMKPKYLAEQKRLMVEYKAELASMPAPMRAAVTALDGLKGAWQKFKDANQTNTLGFLTDGFGTLAAAVPKLQPLFDAANGAARRLMERLGEFVQNGGLDKLVTFLADRAAPVFGAFGAALKGAAGFAKDMAGPLRSLGGQVKEGLKPAAGVMDGFKDSFTAMVDTIKEDGSLKGATDGLMGLIGAVLRELPKLIPPLLNIAQHVFPVLEKAVTAAGTVLSGLAQWLSRHLPPVLDKVSEGMSRLATFIREKVVPAARDAGRWFGDHLWPILKDVGQFIVQHVVPALGELAKGFGGGLKDAITGITGVLEKHREQFDAVARVVGKLLDVLGPIVGGAIGLAFKALGLQVQVFLTVWAGIITAFQKVIEWARKIPGAVRVAFNVVVDIAKGLPGRIGRAVVGLFAGLSNRAVTVVITVRNKLGEIVSFVRGLPGKVWSAAGGIMDGIKEAVARGVRWITDRIGAVINFIKSIPGHVASAVSTVARATARYAPGGGLLSLFGHAAGGVIGGAAAGGPRGGLTWVGEQGPELLRIPSGSQMWPAGTSQVMAGQQGGGGGGEIHITLNLGTAKLGKVILDPLRKTVRGKGGLTATFGT